MRDCACWGRATFRLPLCEGVGRYKVFSCAPLHFISSLSPFPLAIIPEVFVFVETHLHIATLPSIIPTTSTTYTKGSPPRCSLVRLVIHQPKQPAHTGAMTVSRGKEYIRPVKVVERQPTNTTSSPPTSPTSPKAVHFAKSTSQLVTGISRELTPTEAWSLYHFEIHARRCENFCRDPLRGYLRGRRMCDTGSAYAKDVALHIYYKDGDIYAVQHEGLKPTRVEVPTAYDQVRSLLQKYAYRARKHASRPTVTHDLSRKAKPTHDRAPERTEVVIEPGDSRRDKRSSDRKTKAKSSHYKTVVVHEDGVAPESAPAPLPAQTLPDTKLKERRGSLYHSDRPRKTKQYHVEERLPSWERSKREEKRKSGVYL